MICPDAYPAGVNFPDAMMADALNPVVMIAGVSLETEDVVAVAQPFCLPRRPVGNPPAS
jgi:hypothetical protein